MTLAALLEELKEVDAEPWDYIQTMRWGLGYDLDNPIIQAIIQGEIQRACERRDGWEASIWWKDNRWVALIRLPGGYIDPHKVFAEESDSAAEALLAAYIAAVREEAKR